MTSTPAWFVKDYADGWIKYYDLRQAVATAQETGAIMRYRVDGTPPPACEIRRAARVEGLAECDYADLEDIFMAVWEGAINPEKGYEQMKLLEAQESARHAAKTEGEKNG